MGHYDTVMLLLLSTTINKRNQNSRKRGKSRDKTGQLLLEKRLEKKIEPGHDDDQTTG